MERDRARRERPCEQPSRQIAQPLSSTPQGGESSADSPQDRQRGRAQPDRCADGRARDDRASHEPASHGEPDPVRSHLDQAVRGVAELLDESQETLDRSAARSGC